MYNDNEETSKRIVPDTFKNEKKQLKELKIFLGRDIQSSRALELIGSLHYIVSHAKNKVQPDQEIIDRLLELKPKFSEGETRFYLKKIRELLS